MVKTIYVLSDYFKASDFMKHLSENTYNVVNDIQSVKHVDFVYIDHTTDRKIKNYIYHNLKYDITNHVELDNQFVDKAILHELVKQRSKKLYDKYFMPQYKLDKHFNQLKNLDKTKMYIVKPVGGFAGIGIKVFNGTSGIKEYITKYNNKSSKKKSWVIQHYIDDPMLLKGRKFHMRVMVLLYGDNVYFYRDSIVFPAKKLFTNDNLDEEIHDTHGTLTESHEKVMFPYDVKNIWNVTKIHSDMVNLLTWLKKIGIFKNKCYKDNKKCFEFYGMDIMMDSQQNIKCLEINYKPGLTNMLKRMPYLIKGVIELVIENKDTGKGYCKI